MWAPAPRRPRRVTRAGALADEWAAPASRGPARVMGSRRGAGRGTSPQGSTIWPQPRARPLCPCGAWPSRLAVATQAKDAPGPSTRLAWAQRRGRCSLRDQSGAGARGTSLRGRRGRGAGRRSLGAEPQLCILITGNHRWLAAPPAVGGRRTSTRLSFSSSHHPRSYLLPLPERRGPQRARAPVSCCTWGHRGPGSRRTLPRTGHGAGRAAAGVGLSWFEPSPGHRPARDLELIP